MASLWAMMIFCFGRAWSSQRGEKSTRKDERGEKLTMAAKTWLSGLDELMLGNIHLGIDKLAKWDHPDPRFAGMPPNLQQFRDLCRPTADELGIPGVEVAFHSAAKGEWIHPIIWHAANEIGFHALRNHGESVTRKRFAEVYSKLVGQARNGRKFNIKRSAGPAISYQPPTDLKPSKTPQEHLQDFHAILGNGDENAGQ